MSRLPAWVGVWAAAACLLLVLAATSSATAPAAARGNVKPLSVVQGPITWGNGVEALLPANADPARGSSVASVSCPLAGNCSAVGSYIDTSGNTEGLLLTETSGQWAPGVEAVRPANADPARSYGVWSLSCPSAGNCAAIGAYTDNSGSQEGLLLTESGGTWSAGVEAALPSDAAPNPYVVLRSVSCASAGNCTAVGSYNASGNSGLLVTETNGVWGTGMEAILPANASTTFHGAWLDSVSCPSAGECTAVGAYPDNSGSPFVGLLVTETAGQWARGTEAALPADSTDHNAEITSVSCASPGNCTAVGLYDVEYPFSKFYFPPQAKTVLLTETAGSWAAPAEATIVDPGYLPAVSCSTAENCSAVGAFYYYDLLLTQGNGRWTSDVEASPGTYSYNSVSCASAGNCGASIGGGRLLTETRGSWGTSGRPPVPANAKPGSGMVNGVSCPSTGVCAAVGTYVDGSGRTVGLLAGGSPAAAALVIDKGGTGAGTVSSSPAGIDCGATCSVTIDAGAQLTLTATPAVGSRFSGWSGGGCSGTGTCRPYTGVTDQTVTASFNLLSDCVVPKVAGMTLKSARQKITSRHCSVGTITRAKSRKVLKGRVISQSPKPGTDFRQGAAVNLKVSKGQ